MNKATTEDVIESLRVNVGQLAGQLAAVTAERDAMLAAITAFCAEQMWCTKTWKAQSYIKPLFDIYEKENK